MDRREKRSVENLVLAIVRTELANRRTLLSYLNTSIALLVSGVGLLRLSGSNWLETIGIALIPRQYKKLFRQRPIDFVHHGNAQEIRSKG